VSKFTFKHGVGRRDLHPPTVDVRYGGEADTGQPDREVCSAWKSGFPKSEVRVKHRSLQDYRTMSSR
jgi:hypothetical protein